QEARLKSHFDQSVRQLLVGFASTANLPSRHQDFVMEADEHEISLRDSMPPHLVNIVEKVRNEHGRKIKKDQSYQETIEGHTRQATQVLSDAMHTVYSPPAMTLKKVLRILTEAYEYVVDVLVLAYAIYLGVEIDYKTYYRQEPSWAHTADVCFCILFVCDLLIRMALARGRFVTGTGRWWNLLDTVTVILFVANLLVLDNELLETSSTAFRNVLLWLLILIFGNAYIFSLVFTEGSWHLCPNPEIELVCQKFGSLKSSIMTLLQIQYNGFLWGVRVEVRDPFLPAFLVFAISRSSLWDELETFPWYFQSTLLTFVALLVMANTITSFICSLQTIVTKRERDLLIDKELEYNEKIVGQLYKTFHELDTNGNGAVSWTEFQLALQDERMHAFLSTLELDMSDAKKIFHILASEQTNAIEESDFLLGCLRMRGGASGVDMVRIQMEQEWLHNAMAQTRTLVHKITRLLAAERLSGPGIRNSRVIQEQMSETSSGWNPDIHDFNPDEPVLEVEADDIQLHAFQRSNLQSWQRAVTLQELLTIRSDLPRLCHGWRSERFGHHLVPEKLNLHLCRKGLGFRVSASGSGVLGLTLRLRAESFSKRAGWC
ncbi:Scn8a, partial [Symbiodinium microadriaticum]